ncbi:MAG: glycosyltransferase [Candidatus Wildermuthbacteria bacterium]|nr:glycosyltransferase [Candidatus Wildermuthbacteria bacterium]
MEKTITWVNFPIRRSGGFAYGALAREVLASEYEVELKDFSFDSIKIRSLKPFLWFFYLMRLWFKKPRSAWIRDDIMGAIVPLWTRKKNILLIYHIDPTVFPGFFRIFYKLAEKFIYWNARKADAIVTISDYWQQYFLKKGFRNVHKIYWAFAVQEQAIGEAEIAEFKKKFHLEDKPIVYLGNCQKEKGVVEAYEALKGLPAHLVTSGKPMVQLPALNLDLSHREYLCLLKASFVVLTMSKFKEGWCITAHEAMLSGTPVIGSGLGGMRELLEGGNQMVCEDFGLLRERVEYFLQNPDARSAMGRKGYEYAKNFSLERFKKEWFDLSQNHIDKE